LPAILGIA